MRHLSYRTPFSLFSHQCPILRNVWLDKMNNLTVLSRHFVDEGGVAHDVCFQLNFDVQSTQPARCSVPYRDQYVFPLHNP